jgi:hypothetical protein
MTSTQLGNQASDIGIIEPKTIHRAEQRGDHRPVGHVADVGRQSPRATCRIEESPQLHRIIDQPQGFGDFSQLEDSLRRIPTSVLNVAQIRGFDIHDVREMPQTEPRRDPRFAQHFAKGFLHEKSPVSRLLSAMITLYAPAALAAT